MNKTSLTEWFIQAWTNNLYKLPIKGSYTQTDLQIFLDEYKKCKLYMERLNDLRSNKNLRG